MARAGRRPLRRASGRLRLVRRRRAAARLLPPRCRALRRAPLPLLRGPRALVAGLSPLALPVRARISGAPRPLRDDGGGIRPRRAPERAQPPARADPPRTGEARAAGVAEAPGGDALLRE